MGRRTPPGAPVAEAPDDQPTGAGALLRASGTTAESAGRPPSGPLQEAAAAARHGSHPSIAALIRSGGGTVGTILTTCPNCPIPFRCRRNRCRLIRIPPDRFPPAMDGW